MIALDPRTLFIGGAVLAATYVGMDIAAKAIKKFKESRHAVKDRDLRRAKRSLLVVVEWLQSQDIDEKTANEMQLGTVIELIGTHEFTWPKEK